MEINFANMATIIGILGGILGILNQLHNIRKEQTENIKAQAIRDQQMDDRLKSIESKVDEHNGYAKMFSEVRESIVAIETDIKWLRGNR